MKLISLVVAASLSVYGQPPAQAPATGARDLFVTVGKSVLVDSPATIERVSVANGEVAEAVAITPREVLVNGKAAGETSLIVWQQGGNRLFFDLFVQRNESRMDAIRREMAKEVGDQKVTLDVEGDSVFVRGVVTDLVQADRAMAIAATIGKPINLLKVNVPGTDTQILLKVRFADVDRSSLRQLGINFFSTGATNAIGSVTTGQFSPVAPTQIGAGAATTLNLTNALNVFLFRPDLNLGTTISALESKNLLQILAEPNVLALNGHHASFLAGGEFPYPTLQGGGAGLGAVTIQFREFGVRLGFTPVVTPRGTLRLSVQPEVSTLDFANGLVFQGFTIPALSTRRVNTDIELEDGQSFAIGGLLDNRDTETFNKIPGLANIPFFGKLFRSRQITKNNTELLVLVTPEIVHPIPAGKPIPTLNYPSPFLPPNTSSTPPQTPGISQTGAVPPKAEPAPIPVEQLMKIQQSEQGQSQQAAPAIQFVPVPLMPQPINPPQPAPAKTPGSSPSGGNQ
ncbi:MAG TPA: pilus assembly protein N-terminal domain-containing protein [Bryobacteraceae bacterium]|nr:pilus assembly protein N-terminal domain-containing protein [Bryobacteraceae bacterium]